MLAEGRKQLAAGKSMMVPRFDIVPIRPGMRTNLAEGSHVEFPFEVVESMYTFCANNVVGNIAPRPLLLLHPSVDTVTPSEQSVDLFARAGQPTDLHLVADVDHFMLAENNVMALAASPPNMAYHGARAAGVSTAPLSIAVPGAGPDSPIVLDMATGIVSRALDAGQTSQGNPRARRVRQPHHRCAGGQHSAAAGRCQRLGPVADDRIVDRAGHRQSADRHLLFR